MRRTCLAVLGFAVLILSPSVRAGDKTAGAPDVVVRVKSLSALLQNLNLVVKLVGQQDAADQIEGVIKSKLGPKGIEGIDPSRPIGAYVRFGKDLAAVHGAFLVPISDEKSFLTLLENIGVETKTDKDGVYTYKTNKNVDVYFRFANRYVYVTSVNALSIQGENLPDPAKALQMSGDATFSVLARMGQIPDDAKSFAVLALQESIQSAKKGGAPGESQAQQAFRIAILDDTQELAKSVLAHADEIRLDLHVSEKTKELVIDFSITPKAGSELAKSIQALGNLKSPLGLASAKDAAVQAGFHVNLPANTAAALGKVIDEAAAQSLASIQDPAKRSQADALFKAILPTAKAGEYNVAAAIVGPRAQRYTFLAAVKLKDGAKLGSVLRGLMLDAKKQMPAAEQSKVQLDYDKAGAIAIHRLELPRNPSLDGLLEDVVGDRHLHLAFRDDAMFLALGNDASAALKEALVGGGEKSRPVLLDVDVARLAKWLARTPKQRDQADKLLASGAGSRIHVTLEGGTSLRGSIRTHFNVLELLVREK